MLGIDLASARWTFNGSALLHFDAASGAFTRVVPGAVAWPDPRDVPLTPPALAAAIHAFAVREDVRAVALDGPHAWRHPDTAAHLPGVGRRCEYACRTQGKTGVYPRAYPRTQFAWIDFCVQVFDWLLAQPGVRLAGESEVAAPHAPAPTSALTSAGRSAPGPSSEGYVALECFPTAIWRTSGLMPLPAKSKRPDVPRFYDTLAAAFALPSARVTSHDDLQAVVAALAAAGAVGGPVRSCAHGDACCMAEHADGARRVEGFIWDAAPASLDSAV